MARERKLTMDRDGAIKLLEAARRAGVERYVMISSIGAENPPDGDDVFSVYLRAKAQADAALVASDRGWTIVRPGFLTDEPGTGRARLTAGPSATRSAATTSRRCWPRSCTSRAPCGHTLYVVAGDDPIEQALAAVLGG